MPQLLVIQGLPGSGKSALARVLSNALGWIHLDTDAQWLKLFANPCYSEEESNAVFLSLLCATQSHIGTGASVILDGVLASRVRFESLVTLCQKALANLLIVRLHCSREIALMRVGVRLAQSNEARPAIPPDRWDLLRGRMSWEPHWGQYLELNSEYDSSEALTRIVIDHFQLRAI